MKLIIAGTRTFSYPATLNMAVDEFCAKHGVPTEVVSGGANGADDLGEKWAKLRRIPVTHFPADWTEHGNKAGPLRNQQMALYADALIAFWDGFSPGTKDMIRRMETLGKTVKVWHI